MFFFSLMKKIKILGFYTETWVLEKKTRTRNSSLKQKLARLQTLIRMKSF